MRRIQQHGSFRHEVQRLKHEVTLLKKQANGLRDRVDRIAPGTREKQCAVVSASRCTGCGMCEQVCPVGAVRVTHIAHVNTERCTGCGVCVRNCPQEAIRLRKA